MLRNIIKRRFSTTTIRFEKEIAPAGSLGVKNDVSLVLPSTLKNLTDPFEEKVSLGKDIGQRVREDIFCVLQSIENLNLTEQQKKIKIREIELYLQSINRLQSDKYTQLYKRDEKLEKKRGEEYVKNVNIPKRLNKRYQRWFGFDFKTFSDLPAEQQRALKRQMLENEEKILLDLENVHHQGKYKIGRFSSWIKAFKSDRARSVNKADYRNQIDTESFRPEEDKTPKTELIAEELYIDKTSSNDIDVTVPTAFNVEDIRDDMGNKWTENSWIKRTMIYSIILSVVAASVYMCISDLVRQEEDGGFQGIYFGRTRVF